MFKSQVAFSPYLYLQIKVASHALLAHILAVLLLATMFLQTQKCERALTQYKAA